MTSNLIFFNYTTKRVTQLLIKTKDAKQLLLSENILIFSQIISKKTDKSSDSI